MASNQTANLGLSQWEADDDVLRADFNADNAKIDAEIGLLRSNTLLLDETLTAQTTLWRISLTDLDLSLFRQLVLYPEFLLTSHNTIQMYFNNEKRTDRITHAGSPSYLSWYNVSFYIHPYTSAAHRQLSRVRFDLAFPRVVSEYLTSTYANDSNGGYSGQFGVSIDNDLTWDQVTEMDFTGGTFAPGSRVKLYGVR